MVNVDIERYRRLTLKEFVPFDELHDIPAPLFYPTRKIMFSTISTQSSVDIVSEIPLLGFCTLIKKKPLKKRKKKEKF